MFCINKSKNTFLLRWKWHKNPHINLHFVRKFFIYFCSTKLHWYCLCIGLIFDVTRSFFFCGQSTFDKKEIALVINWNADTVFSLCLQWQQLWISYYFNFHWFSVNLIIYNPLFSVHFINFKMKPNIRQCDENLYIIFEIKSLFWCENWIFICFPLFFLWQKSNINSWLFHQNSLGSQHFCLTFLFRFPCFSFY